MDNSKTSQTRSEELVTLLQEERRLTHRLLELLRSEHRTLSGDDIDALAPLVEAKHCLIADMEALENRRIGLLRDASYPATETGMLDYLARHQPSAKQDVHRCWREVLTLAEDCRQQNLINGSIMQARYRHSVNALSLLRGKPAEESGRYGPEGTTGSPAGSGILARA